MAYSFSMKRNGSGTEDTTTGALPVVTQGTSAPGAGDIEVRISSTVGWTKHEIELALDTIWRTIVDPGRSTTSLL